ncbi:hypothetical protein ACSQ67_010185 [Phaseolus vulgaris]
MLLVIGYIPKLGETVYQSHEWFEVNNNQQAQKSFCNLNKIQITRYDATLHHLFLVAVAKDLRLLQVLEISMSNNILNIVENRHCDAQHDDAPHGNEGDALNEIASLKLKELKPEIGNKNDALEKEFEFITKIRRKEAIIAYFNCLSCDHAISVQSLVKKAIRAMSEIVPAEPIEGIYFERGETSTASASTSEAPHVTLAITNGTNNEEYAPEPFDSERLPTVFASEIQRFLRVANLLGKEEPRVAYLCRVHAFVIAHNLDKNSSGRGVRQFKTSLLHRLEQDEHVTKKRGTSDIRELKNVYRAYRDYYSRHDKAFDLEQSRRQKLINARDIASVLFEVLKTVTDPAASQALIQGNAIHRKTEFNILPLEQGGIQHAIMQQPEIKAAIAVIRNVRGLPPAQDFKRHGSFVDLFDFLQHCFGFQEANVANQREHLILLLSNMQTRQTHNQTSALKMAYELHGILSGAISLTTWEKVMPAYGGEPESFLNNVVTPIYTVIRKEVDNCNGGASDHSIWRNYDDLNEYFWSPDCFKIGWPMRLDHDFFFVKSRTKPKADVKNDLAAIYLTTNAVEVVLFFVPSVAKYIEVSNYKICRVLSWWTQPRIYVGRGMQEDQVSVLKYTLFWILVLSCKFLFSYTFEIKPLIAPTRQIMKIGVHYEWHELFPKVKSNAGAIVAVWSPVVIVYFMDTQIWYSVFCTIIGGLYGILHHLGEIRTLGMLRSRFDSLPSAFNVCLIPPSSKRGKKKRKGFLSNIFQKLPDEKNATAKFVVVWNQIVNQLRLEDLISNREMDLMMMPVSSELFSSKVRWPVFLLANKFSTALTIAKDFEGKEEILVKKITKDKYMFYAVRECYQSLKYVLEILVEGSMEKRIICDILSEIEKNIQETTLLQNFNIKVLPALHAKVVELAELLMEGEKDNQHKVVKALLDIFELVVNDMMVDSRILDMLQFPDQNECGFVYFRNDDQLFETVEMNRDFYPFSNENSIQFPLPENGPMMEKIKRFHLLLTVKETAMDMPANLDARRRISFFATSLFTDMPDAPKVHNMMPFCVITPHYIEDINFSLKELGSDKEEDSIIFYMQKIYPDEWTNFLERMGCENRRNLEDELEVEDLRQWASFRGQTLSRTVRGMMYYREALKLQAFLDMAEEEDILEGYETAERGNRALFARLEALADMKYTYVISCQSFASQKAMNDPRYQDMIDLMTRYPSLRVAYVEEKEKIVQGRTHKVYSSKLVKVVNGFEQDNYLEEALKMRNLLQEFLRRQGRRPPTILGLREHIFTGSVSSLAWFMSYQETSFVTIGQRLLANPLRVRFHYGHPDVFDRVFHITRGGISKASKTINLSEDVFAGFNSTLRRGCISYHEYLQIGKGRDVALNQISKFEAKVANGNCEQTISRDIFRLGRQFDFFRMLSCYFTTIGFYFSSLISVIGIYVFLYGQLYLVLSGLERALIVEARLKNVQSLETALASQSFIQLGLLTGLPMVMEIGLEKGFLTALKDFVLMQLQLAAVFFTFALGTKTHYYGRTLLHGGAKYRPTGRKVVFHASFTENYRLYSRSHFVKAFELLLLLIVYNMFRRSYQSDMAYVLITYAIWFMSLTWLCAPFLFNPAGFSWTKTVDDWKEWNKWIRQQGGIGIQQDKSWHSWWHDEQTHLRWSGLASRFAEILLSLRFFIYQYGLVYHLDISQHSKNFLVYVLSWIVIVAIFLLVKAVNIGRKLLSANYQLGFRLFKAFLFLAVLALIFTLSIICQLSLMDLFVCCLAFMPTAWGLILIAQAVRPKIEHTGLWDFTRALAREFDYGMGIVLFGPIAILAWLPIIKAFHARFLFNEAFKRHLQIQPILSGKKKKHRT